MATSIFTSQTPSITNGDDGTDYTLGTAFRRSNSGSITHGRWYFPDPVPTGTTQFVLYNSSGTELSRASFSSPTPGAWNTVALPSAISYTANDLLVASIYTSGKYVATANFFTSDLVNGDITAPGDTNGRLGNTDEYPSTVSGNDACFFADIVFAAGGTTTPISLSGSVSPAGALSRQTGKPLAGSTTPTGAALRQTIRTLTGAIAPAGVLARTAVKPLGGLVMPTGTLVRQTSKALSGTVVPSGAVSRLVSKTLGGTVTPSGGLAKVLGRLLGGSIAPAGALSTSVVQPVVGGSMSHADRSAASASHTARTGPTMTGR